MNQANKVARSKAAVAVVNAVILLLKLESKQYKQHSESAWKCTEALTPHGENLCSETFAKVDDFCLYDITITYGGNCWNCKAVRTNTNKRI